MFDGSLRPNAAPDSNSTGPSWRGLKTAKKRRWETLLMNGSCERLQSGKGDVRAPFGSGKRYFPIENFRDLCYFVQAIYNS